MNQENEVTRSIKVWRRLRQEMASSPIVGHSIIPEKPPEMIQKVEKTSQPIKKWTTQILRMLGIRGEE